jgi:hypothetical protein
VSLKSDLRYHGLSLVLTALAIIALVLVIYFGQEPR